MVSSHWPHGRPLTEHIDSLNVFCLELWTWRVIQSFLLSVRTWPTHGIHFAYILWVKMRIENWIMVLYISATEMLMLRSDGWQGASYEKCALRGYYAACGGNFLTAFGDNLTVPSSGIKIKKKIHWFPEKHKFLYAHVDYSCGSCLPFPYSVSFHGRFAQKQDNIRSVRAVSSVFPVGPISFDSAVSKHCTVDIRSFIHWDMAVCCVSEIIRNMARHRLMSKEPLEDMKWYYATEQEFHCCILTCHYRVSCNIITMYPVSVIHSHLPALWRKKKQ